MSFPDLLNLDAELLSAAETGGSRTSVSLSAGESAISSKNIFYMMTKEQAQKSGVVDEFLRADTDGNGEISEEEFIDYKTSSESSGNTSTKVKNFASMTPEEKIEYMKQEISEYIDMSKADEKFNGMDITEALKEIGITQELLEANGLTIEKIKENPEEFGKLLYKQLNEKYQNDINNKDGEVWQTEYQRLKNGEFTDYEKEKLGLSGELTEEQLEAYTKIAIGQKYAATMAAMIMYSGINTDDEETMALYAGVAQGLSSSFFEDNEKASMITCALTRMAESKNIYTEQTASKAAENPEAYGINGADEEIFALATAMIVQTASAESIEKFILSNPEHSDLIKQITENVISSMPDSSRKEALQKTLNSAMSKVESKTSSSKDTKTSAPVSTQNIAADTPQILTNTTNPNIAQTAQTDSDVSVSSLSVEKSTPKIYINSLSGVVDDIEKFKKGSLETGLNELVELYNGAGSSVAVKSKIKYFFSSLKPDFRAEMYASGSNSMRAFMSEQNLVTVYDLASYFAGKDEELKKFGDTDPHAYELVKDFMSTHVMGKK